MRRAALSVLACLFLAVSAAPAGAVTKTIAVVDFAFNPKGMSVAQGTTVNWQNTGTRTHTATQDAGFFNTGNIAPGTTSAGKVLTAAGGYAYHCTIHPSMVASVKVPVKVAPTSGTTATVFTVTVATVTAPTWLRLRRPEEGREHGNVGRLHDRRDDRLRDLPGDRPRGRTTSARRCGRSRRARRPSPRPPRWSPSA